jgi:NAD(P)-dependent dehydrogenase (short-subunit alcohol dehydrogenase family)
VRILVVGGAGTVGKAAISGLRVDHELVIAGRTSGDVKVDLMDEASVTAMYKQVGKVDAVVAATGHSHFGPVKDMTPKQFLDGLKDKLMGQIHLVLLGMAHVNDHGSFTLTSGVLSHEAIRQGSNAAACDGALDSFVISAAIEMPRAIRINAVSPGLLEAAAKKYDGYFPGHRPVSNAEVGLAFAKSIEGAVTGQVIRCW